MSEMLESVYTALPQIHAGVPFSLLSGCLKAHVSSLQFCFEIVVSISVGPGGDPDLPPFSVAFVKGWRRATALLSIIAGIKELEIPVEEIPRHFHVAWLVKGLWIKL